MQQYSVRCDVAPTITCATCNDYTTAVFDSVATFIHLWYKTLVCRYRFTISLLDSLKLMICVCAMYRTYDVVRYVKEIHHVAYPEYDTEVAFADHGRQLRLCNCSVYHIIVQCIVKQFCKLLHRFFDDLLLTAGVLHLYRYVAELHRYCAAITAECRAHRVHLLSR